MTAADATRGSSPGAHPQRAHGAVPGPIEHLELEGQPRAPAEPADQRARRRDPQRHAHAPSPATEPDGEDAATEAERLCAEPPAVRPCADPACDGAERAG